MEYAVESAAVCNPSMVAHPDQSGVATGELRFVMSLRAVGEGHRSSVEFRTGVVGPARTVTLDAPSPVLVVGTRRPVTYERDLFLALLADLGSDVETVDRVIGGLPALFPRKVGGRYLALSRWDRENVSLGTSVDGRVWHRAGTLCPPREGWQLVQVGNCGSPIETEAGWLVLTHGVGPMRTYRIGAVLLDRDDPSRVLGRLPKPLLSPTESEREGYVPNVVYSCGAMTHAGHLILPYAMSDLCSSFATVPLADLLEALLKWVPGPT